MTSTVWEHDRMMWMMMKRQRKKTIRSPFERKPLDNSLNYKLDKSKFASRCDENKYLDISTKIAALKANASVVSLVTYSGDKEIFQGTGTIIEEDGTILTSAKLVTCPTRENVVAEKLKVIVYLWDEKSYEADVLAYDFYYGIAGVKIRGEDVPKLKPACLRHVDDCISLEHPAHYDKGFQLRPHSNDYRLVPGDKVIALGRYYLKPYSLMAAPGEFSINQCDNNECKELFRATCKITRTGTGGPLVNHHGEVIGVTMYDFYVSPFLPINIALKWWEHCKKPGLRRQPLIGMELANLYTTNIQVMEMVDLKFPDYMAGVIVEKVEKGSSAETAGICPNDLIVECCGKPVRSFLKLFDMMWDKTGDSVDLVVLRPADGATLRPKVDILDATTQKKRKRSKKRKKSKKRKRSKIWSRS